MTKAATQLDKMSTRAAAQRIAAAEGLKWNDLSEEERSERRLAAASSITDADRKEAARMLAKRKDKKSKGQT